MSKATTNKSAHKDKVDNTGVTPSLVKQATVVLSTQDFEGKKVWYVKSVKNDKATSKDTTTNRTAASDTTSDNTSSSSSTSSGTIPDNIVLKKMGHIRAAVFHPKDLRCVGYMVRRPDIALMFHRSDAFVSYLGLHRLDGKIILDQNPQSIEKGACKALGIKLDDCILWEGLPIVTQDGTTLGTVGNVKYDAHSGQVIEVEVSQGSTANALLGRRIIPADEIKGFRHGIGTRLYQTNDVTDDESLGAILVEDCAKQNKVEGGVAAAAGEATAIVADKAKTTYKKAKTTYKKVVKKSAPTVKKVTKTAGEAIDKGAYVTGRQIGRTTGMFSKFKEEFQKGLNGEDDKQSSNGQ